MVSGKQCAGIYPALIPLVNDCYDKGKSGTPYTLPNTDDEIKTEFRCNLGEAPNAQELKILSLMFTWCRDAYQQGAAEQQ